MTNKTRMKMSEFLHRLIYLVLGVEAVIIMVYMMVGMTSCSEDNDVDTPAAALLSNRSFEGTVQYDDDYLTSKVKYTLSFSSDKDYILHYENTAKSKKGELQDMSLVENVGTYTIDKNNNVHLEAKQITSSMNGIIFTRDVCVENNLVFDAKAGKLIKNKDIELSEIEYKTFPALEGNPIAMAPNEIDLEIFVGKWHGHNPWTDASLDFEVWGELNTEGQNTYRGKMVYTPSERVGDRYFTEPWVNEGEISFNGCLCIGDAMLECFCITDESILFTTFYKAPGSYICTFDPMIKVEKPVE